MPKRKAQKHSQTISRTDLRHAEYYAMQAIIDKLYEESGQRKIFTDLMDIILKRENILLAYRNIKANTGSNTAGTDKLTIKDIGQMSPDEMVDKVRKIIQGHPDWGYRPRPVRRKDIPKPNGSTRPLGIPCIWDRLIQQCIKQIMEPICEAKFSDRSYGFRPNRSVENAIQATYKLLQNSHLHYVVEFDIKGFFDNVDHSKLIKQIWTMGIRDKQLLWIIKRILKAPIKMPDGTIVNPSKGTPQGGIISPLLANIVLNELDQWVESQWRGNPVARKYSIGYDKQGYEILSGGYSAMRRTSLKEMHIVRYADDFRIFCRTREDAEKTKIAVTLWLKERLRLEISQEKTRVVDVKHQYSEFLGFRIKVHPKGEKLVVKSRMTEKQLKKAKKELTEQARKIVKPSSAKNEYEEAMIYNAMVVGIQNYYRIATHITMDMNELSKAITNGFMKQLKRSRRIKKTGRDLTRFEKERYGASKSIRYLAGSKAPIYPIGYIRHRAPMAKRRDVCIYTEKGRAQLHANLRVNTYLMLDMMRQPSHGGSTEYADNRISLFSAQWGKCAIMGKPFETLSDIHCHHIIPRENGGNDEYNNLVLVDSQVHILIHATKKETINKVCNSLGLTPKQKEKLNKFRQKAGNSKIE